jgi:hypothetical protein
MIENPIRAVGWIWYPKALFRTYLRIGHGKRKSDIESNALSAISNPRGRLTPEQLNQRCTTFFGSLRKVIKSAKAITIGQHRH